VKRDVFQFARQCLLSGGRCKAKREHAYGGKAPKRSPRRETLDKRERKKESPDALP